jgi:hypothetical protein
LKKIQGHKVQKAASFKKIVKIGESGANGTLFFLTAGIPVFFYRISSFWSHKKEKKLNFLLYVFQTHATLQEKVI